MILDHLTARAHADHHTAWTDFALSLWRRRRRGPVVKSPTRLA